MLWLARVARVGVVEGSVDILQFRVSAVLLQRRGLFMLGLCVYAVGCSAVAGGMWGYRDVNDWER